MLLVRLGRCLYVRTLISGAGRILQNGDWAGKSGTGIVGLFGLVVLGTDFLGSIAETSCARRGGTAERTLSQKVWA